jgi:hypothetical protein
MYFWHTYTLLSEATFRALQTDAYLSQNFVDVETQTFTQSSAGTYTGVYLFMKQTLLESLVGGTVAGYPQGGYGIAFMDEVPGGIDELAASWRAQFGGDQVTGPYDVTTPTADGGMRRVWQELDPNWSNASMYTGVWAMEYPSDSLDAGRRTRRELEAGHYSEARLARDIEAELFAVPAAEMTLLQRTFTSAGWAVSTEGDGFVAASLLDDGVHRRMHAVPQGAGPVGLLGVRMSLNRYERHTENIGEAVLEVGQGGQNVAYLWFGSPSLAQRAILEEVALTPDAPDASADAGQGAGQPNGHGCSAGGLVAPSSLGLLVALRALARRRSPARR